MGLTMQEKKAVTRQIHSRYQNAQRKEKSEILNECIQLTGYNRKYALRILNQHQSPLAMLVANGEMVKLKPRKKRPANRKGKKIYTGKIIASRSTLVIAPAVREKFMAVSPIHH
jgi:hypothetical protein